jgi:hypothetical protein
MMVRLTQIDGKLPNLALMKLAHWHKAQGDSVHFSDRIHRDLFEPEYDLVLGSSIFKFSEKARATFKREFPLAVIGGTGTDDWTTVEEIIGEDEYENYDYSIYPNFKHSIGFTQRGCRLKCKFCVVPQKEGKNRNINSIYDIWRDGTERKVHLLDNDFFGSPDWRDVAREIIEGDFQICLNQGINVRLIDEEACETLSRMQYRDDQFKAKRLYTAWDNFKDGDIFFRGVDMLEKAGIPPKHLMVYMLIGYDKNETWERIFDRFNRMVARGISPYPMVFDHTNLELKKFQRWVIRRYYQFIPWEQYNKKFTNEFEVQERLFA